MNKVKDGRSTLVQFLTHPDEPASHQGLITCQEIEKARRDNKGNRARQTADMLKADVNMSAKCLFNKVWTRKEFQTNGRKVSSSNCQRKNTLQTAEA